jgi:hypothetical protein
VRGFATKWTTHSVYLLGARKAAERLRAALQVMDAVSNSHSLWIATCISIATLPPELRRRFTLETFFFDLPNGEERHAVWKIYESRYGVAGQRPDDDGRTGAEIKECCREAYRLQIPRSLPGMSCRYPVRPPSRSGNFD